MVDFDSGPRLLAWVETPSGRAALTPLARAGAALHGAVAGLAGWTWRAVIRPLDSQTGRWRCDLTVQAGTGGAAALRIALAEIGPAPRWLIPATFYDENRPSDSPRRYPRWGDEADPWSATAWLVSAERAAAPFTSVRTDKLSAALIADAPYWENHPVGLGLDAADGNSLLLRFPYAEWPRSNAPCRGDDCAADLRWAQLAEGDELSVAFELQIQPGDAPLYPALLRASYARHRAASNPWMPLDAAAALLADGLLCWHYDPQHAVLAETCAFDHYFRPTDRQTDRAAMHVAWLSGIPTAFALLRQGGAATEAGRRVIDHICRDGFAPCGAFWAQWTLQGWATCWYGPPENAPPWLQATTTAEATVFLLQAAAHERAAGLPQPAWEAAALRNLHFVAARQRADGNLGAYYDASTGAVTVWAGTAGLLWIAALVAGWRLTGERRWLEIAERAAAYYAPFVLDDRLRGAPEDVPLGPTSEDGYCALRAYWDLYAATAEARWLQVARHALDWTLTFRWQYNVRLPPQTFLGSMDFRTVGGDLASPSNQHLHIYGLIVLREQLELWRATGDDFYFDTARDLLGFARQTLIRVDGECNGRRGMLTEQWYHVDWTHPQGSMLQLAHAWCNGLAIYAFQEAAAWGEIWLGERVWALEPAALVDATDSPEQLRLHNPFAEPLTLRVWLLAPWSALRLDDVELPLEHDVLGVSGVCTLVPSQRATLAARMAR
jgi:hypothetical protein